MARSRNIKPGLYKNEDLAECSIWARYIFPGLWTMADRRGRLEDRPKRIKGELLPYDSVEVEPLLAELARYGFIARYEVGGVRVIQIITFARHQNPHKREQPSKLPAMPGFVEPMPDAEDASNGPEASGMSGASTLLTEDEALALHRASMSDVDNEASDMPDASTVHAPGSGAMEGGVSPADSLISDSLISDSNTPLPPEGGVRRPRSDPDEEPEGFAAWYALYGRKDAKRDAIKAWRQLDPDDVLQARMIAALVDWPWNPDRTKIPMPATWLRGRRWEDEAVTRAASASVVPEWCRSAGFDNVFDASNAGCWAHTAARFRDGKPLPEGASA